MRQRTEYEVEEQFDKTMSAFWSLVIAAIFVVVLVVSVNQV